MKIFITAKPKSRKEFIKKTDDTHYVVAVNEPPVDGKANKSIIKSLAEYFRKSPSQIYIISGERIKQKVVEVPVSVDEINHLDPQQKIKI